MDKFQSSKKIDYIICAVFICFLIMPSLAWGGIKMLAVFNPSIVNYFDYDIGENRKKAEFPNSLNINTITVELEAYYNDRVPFRSMIIEANNSMTNAMEGVYKDNVRHVLVKVLYNTKNDESSEQEYLPPNIINQKVIEGRKKWLFYYAENSEAYYIGSNVLSDEEMDSYASRIKILSELCEKNGIEFQMIIMPNKEQVYDEYMPNYTIQNEYKRTQRLVDHIKQTTGIEVMYILEEMREAKKYGQLYYKNDTHWNELGAYIGVQLLYERIGVAKTPVEELEYSKIEKEGGDLISLGALNAEDYVGDNGYDIKYKEDITYSEYEKEYVDESGKKYKCKYIRSNASDDRKFVLISDSFRMAMLPYIAKDFSNSVIIYRDEAWSEMAAQEILGSDVLVLELVERYDTVALGTINYLITILSEKTMQE